VQIITHKQTEMTLSEKHYSLFEEVQERWKQLPPFDLTTHPKVVEEYGDDGLEFLYECPGDSTTDRKGYYYLTFAMVGKSEDGNVIIHFLGEEHGQIETFSPTFTNPLNIIELIELYEEYLD
jgi:hypothetical protein